MPRTRHFRDHGLVQIWRVGGPVDTLHEAVDFLDNIQAAISRGLTIRFHGPRGDALQDYIQLVGFDHDITAAGVHAITQSLGVIERGEEVYRHFAAVTLPYLLAGFDAVHFRHRHIGEHDLRFEAEQHLQGLGAVPRRHDNIAVEDEKIRIELSDK